MAKAQKSLRQLKKAYKALNKLARRTLSWSKPRMQRLVLLVVQFLAIISVALGWYLDHGDQSDWVVKVFAPQYTNASKLCRYLYSGNNGELDISVDGFLAVSTVLAELIAAELPELGNSNIVKIGIVRLESMVISSNANLIGPRVILRIDYEDGRRISEVEVPKLILESEIRDRFFEKPMFESGELFQWVGVIITFVVLIIENILKLK